MKYPYPDYLDGASKKALESFDMIRMNKTATKAQKQMMLDEWAKMQGNDTVLAGYMESKDEMMKMGQETMTKIENSKLSDEAKMAAVRIAKLEMQQDLTDEEMSAKYLRILQSLKPEVRKELRMFMDMQQMDMVHKMMAAMDSTNRMNMMMMMTTMTTMS
ncbi:unnamed protein product [Gongylonema pulchrum]|uniref:DUF148 domain-containing protein n=1 Tax=Gongylonema pulchrum TaxID=637853 RepID=A0A183D680_9BILA|nr:unnamed protein product [Gongylonema pulchrum]